MEHAITDMNRSSNGHNVTPPFPDRLEEARVAYVPPHPLPNRDESLVLITA